MAGCYGNHPEDRFYERMLDKYLDKTYAEPEEEEEDYDEEDEDDEESE